MNTESDDWELIMNDWELTDSQTKSTLGPQNGENLWFRKIVIAKNILL